MHFGFFNIFLLQILVLLLFNTYIRSIIKETCLSVKTINIIKNFYSTSFNKTESCNCTTQDLEYFVRKYLFQAFGCVRKWLGQSHAYPLVFPFINYAYPLHKAWMCPRSVFCSRDLNTGNRTVLQPYLRLGSIWQNTEPLTE